MEKLKEKRILGLIGVIGIFLGLFFAYVSVDLIFYSYNITLINYVEGKIIFVLTLINTMYIFKDYVKKYIPKLYESDLGKKVDDMNNPKLLLAPTALIVVLVLYVYSVLDVTGDYISCSLGFYLLWAGVISLVAHSFIYKYKAFDSENNAPMNNGVQNNATMNNGMPNDVSVSSRKD